MVGPTNFVFLLLLLLWGVKSRNIFPWMRVTRGAKAKRNRAGGGLGDVM